MHRFSNSLVAALTLTACSLAGTAFAQTIPNPPATWIPKITITPDNPKFVPDSTVRCDPTYTGQTVSGSQGVIDEILNAKANACAQLFCGQISGTAAVFNRTNFNNCVNAWLLKGLPTSNVALTRSDINATKAQVLGYYRWKYPPVGGGSVSKPTGTMVASTGAAGAPFTWAAADTSRCKVAGSPIGCEFYKRLETACKATIRDQQAFTTCFINFHQNLANKRDCTLNKPDSSEALGCAQWNARPASGDCSDLWALGFCRITGGFSAVTFYTLVKDATGKIIPPKILPRTPGT